MKPSKESEFEETLAGYVLGELSEEEFRQLGNLADSASTGMVKDLERVATLAALSGADPSETMPDKLRQAITAAGRTLVSEINSTPQADAVPQADVVPSASYRAARVRETLAWLACLAATVIAMISWRSNSLPIGNQEVTRQSLMDSAPDLIQTGWTDGKTPLPTKVTGDVVWSNSEQRGFMKFVGMPINDPQLEQYQLWIIDPSRDDEPIDGGVFNITSLGESIIPIQAKLTVGEPKAFAVTIEKPGGVVVSTQERLPLLAMVSEL